MLDILNTTQTKFTLSKSKLVEIKDHILGKEYDLSIVFHYRRYGTRSWTGQCQLRVPSLDRRNGWVPYDGTFDQIQSRTVSL